VPECLRSLHALTYVDSGAQYLCSLQVHGPPAMAAGAGTRLDATTTITMYKWVASRCW